MLICIVIPVLQTSMSVIILYLVLSLTTGYVTTQLGHTSVTVRMVIKRIKQATVVKVGSVIVIDKVRL